MMNKGKTLGVWVLADNLNGEELAGLAKRAESWGYSAIWLPEAVARNPFVSATWILSNTRTINVGIGIANIYARDSLATFTAQYGLAELSQERFLLGLGVSHRPLVEGMRSHVYGKPIQTMTEYLTQMQGLGYQGPPPASKPRTVLGALGPRMLELSRTHADGAHPYNVTPEHTAQAREILGPDKLLCPEQMVLLERDPGVARPLIREAIALYLTLPNYRNNFLRMGFSNEDMEHGGSNRLVDGLVAWGDEDSIRARVQQHWDAGADHVAIQALPQKHRKLSREDEKIYELLAPGQ